MAPHPIGTGRGIRLRLGLAAAVTAGLAGASMWAVDHVREAAARSH